MRKLVVCTFQNYLLQKQDVPLTRIESVMKTILFSMSRETKNTLYFELSVLWSSQDENLRNFLKKRFLFRLDGTKRKLDK